MSAIDVQNSRQIRDPMDVLITLSLGTDIAMTYSGYSNAKVADGVLNQSSWPMRGLADLQGNGFPLDGSRVLYNPNTSPSQTNGKLGVRGNVGQPVSVTATGNNTIAALAISVTGAASVTLSGRTTEITGNHVTLQLLNTTAALTFQPASEDRRIEIITVLPEADFVINNDNLIKATVSLRSDLSIIDPTLPESELNVEVYHDEDISEAVASIPEDTPIIYQAGYPGDMSPVRKFYVSGQVTWADNVLNIHAVDAVHFLDWEIRTPLKFTSLNRAYSLITWLANIRGVSPQSETPPSAGWTGKEFFIEANFNVRDYIAALMNTFHLITSDDATVWINYVDAGRPCLTFSKPTARYQILEDDCESPQKNVERRPSGLNVRYSEASFSSRPVVFGSVSWVKDVGASISYSGDAYGQLGAFGILSNVSENEDALRKLRDYYGSSIASWSIIFPCLPANKKGYNNASAGSYGHAGVLTYTDAAPSDFGYHRPEGHSSDDFLFAGFIPWDAYYRSSEWPYFTSQAEAWQEFVAAGVIGGDETTVELAAAGLGAKFNSADFLTNGAAGDAQDFNAIFVGEVTYGNNQASLYPKPAIQQLLERSPVTCSFTWKGDPRIQPRDVFTFHRLDGTDEEWTFENITITHEGGGTLAEVTARKGIV